MNALPFFKATTTATTAESIYYPSFQYVYHHILKAPRTHICDHVDLFGSTDGVDYPVQRREPQSLRTTTLVTVVVIEAVHINNDFIYGINLTMPCLVYAKIHTCVQISPSVGTPNPPPPDYRLGYQRLVCKNVNGSLSRSDGQHDQRTEDAPASSRPSSPRTWRRPGVLCCSDAKCLFPNTPPRFPGQTPAVG